MSGCRLSPATEFKCPQPLGDTVPCDRVLPVFVWLEPTMQVDSSQPVFVTSNPDAENTIVAGGASLKVDPQRQLKARITERLIGLGSTILSDYADPATDYDPFQPKRRPAAEQIEAKSSDTAVVSAVAKLNKAAQRAFGAVGDFLRYDYSEEFGPLRASCLSAAIGSSEFLSRI